MVAGSDTAWRWGRAGGLPQEMFWLGRAGLSNAAAIRAGTSASAESMGLADVAGNAGGRPAGGHRRRGRREPARRPRRARANARRLARRPAGGSHRGVRFAGPARAPAPDRCPSARHDAAQRSRVARAGRPGPARTSPARLRGSRRRSARRAARRRARSPRRAPPTAPSRSRRVTRPPTRASPPRPTRRRDPCPPRS